MLKRDRQKSEERKRANMVWSRNEKENKNRAKVKINIYKIRDKRYPGGCKKIFHLTPTPSTKIWPFIRFRKRIWSRNFQHCFCVCYWYTEKGKMMQAKKRFTGWRWKGNVWNIKRHGKALNCDTLKFFMEIDQRQWWLFDHFFYLTFE